MMTQLEHSASRRIGTFKSALAGTAPAISAELALKRESGAEDIAAQATLFQDRVDGVQIDDNPLGWVHMSVLAASSVLRSQGIDPVPRMTCRDRNRIGLLSDLLGLRALGVESVLLGRGRRVGKQHSLHASTVFDMTGRELIAMAAAMAEEDGQAPLFIGTGAKAHRAGEQWTAEALTARSEAGAEFLQTQLCFNRDILAQWLEALVTRKLTWRYSVVVSLTVFPSADSARWVKENMLDSNVPKGLIERLDQATDPESEGVKICAEAMRDIARMPGVSGLHLMSMGQPELLAAAIDESGLRGD